MQELQSSHASADAGSVEELARGTVRLQLVMAVVLMSWEVLLPSATLGASVGVPWCFHRRALMLPRWPSMLSSSVGGAAGGDATNRHGNAMEGVWWCYKGPVALLQGWMSELGEEQAALLQVGGDDATGDERWCYKGPPAMLPEMSGCATRGQRRSCKGERQFWGGAWRCCCKAIIGGARSHGRQSYERCAAVLKGQTVLLQE
jgi:hypothetical protein